MSKESINRIKIEWQALFHPIEGLRTGPQNAHVINEITIKRETVPIIFVPGIMGSRLEYVKGGQKAWDPDNPLFMYRNYGLSNVDPEDRKLCLIGDQSHNPNFLKVCKDSSKIPKGTGEKGWGGVAWSFYGKIIEKMTSYQWPEPLSQCFEFPVYAFGYNWTSSNDESGQKLSEYIDEVIGNHADSNCKHVIIVTHSMGGLVARSACILHDADSKVLGVVHGVQPATGSPAAYFRMKSGFEPPGSPTGKGWDWLRNPVRMAVHKMKGHGSRKVLGASGEDVSVLLANMPGGLELLPNKDYLTNNGDRQWLKYTDRDGRVFKLPRTDPYTDIYSKSKVIYRLVNPAWIGSNGAKSDGYDAEEEDSWDDYINNLNDAKLFHSNLGGRSHLETIQFYSKDINTADCIEIQCLREKNKDIYVKAYRYDGYIEIVDQKGKLWPLGELLFLSAFHEREHKDKVVYSYTFKSLIGSGDGTVPDSSGRALNISPTGYDSSSDATISVDQSDESWFKRQHDGIYDTKTAQTITLRAIENLCKLKIKNEAGV